VFGTVRKLREQRCYMVKKQSQYVFLFTYMDLWIKNDLENGADPEKVLFDFGTTTSASATQSALLAGNLASPELNSD